MARISRAEVRGYTLHGVGSGHFPYFFLKGGAVALKDSASRLGELATSPGTMRIESILVTSLSRRPGCVPSGSLRAWNDLVLARVQARCRGVSRATLLSGTTAQAADEAGMPLSQNDIADVTHSESSLALYAWRYSEAVRSSSGVICFR
ncbi:hypothetical protein HPB50_025012 [Hyalomma asiaticum]|uniref:Uncharacterized protein n=1 Tax=Hyalomma asiaticum TaxID=266040 RepID=A0ACB7T416_HYAAI|nr:hypothetical protein HPB50_025012 [Hyalomma asiaticum]